jgi:AcrR family transcriptional regulator
MTGPPSPREALTGRLREVLESLLENDDTSFTDLTVTAICRAAGISRPTFYAYFDDKVGPHRRLMTAAAEVAAYDAELHDAFTSSLEAAARRVSEHITSGQAAGDVREDISPLAAARWLAWMTELGLRNGFTAESVANPESIAAMTDIHWFTLYEKVRS